jgi:thiol-disulfide isomerase/thioredoxin
LAWFSRKGREVSQVKRAAAFLIVGLSVVLFPTFSRGEGGWSAVSHRDPEVVDTTGTKVPFRSFLGRKPLVVIFWATWCPLCRAEVPTLNRLAADPAIQVLAVNLGESEQKVRSFISSFRVGYPVVRDPGWQTTAAYQVVGIPAWILLDGGGEVLSRGNALPEDIETFVRR